jgi:hypothetical protein
MRWSPQVCEAASKVYRRAAFSRAADEMTANMRLTFRGLSCIQLHARRVSTKECLMRLTVTMLTVALLGWVASVQATPISSSDVIQVSDGDPLFNFVYSDPSGDVAHGTLSTVPNGTNFLATSGTLIVTGGPDIGTYPLFPGGPAPTSSPSTQFTFDDLLFPGSPSLDKFGLLFVGGGREINIFYVSASNSYAFLGWDGSHISGGDSGSFIVSSVPEPSSVLLLSTGLVAAASRFRRRRSTTYISHKQRRSRARALPTTHAAPGT